MFNIVLIVIIIVLFMMFLKKGKEPEKKIETRVLPKLSPSKYDQYGYLKIDKVVLEKIKDIVLTYPYSIQLKDENISIKQENRLIHIIFKSADWGEIKLTLDFTNYLTYDQLYFDLENRLKEINEKYFKKTPPPTRPK
ncbi:MAG: hypothetical protein ABIK72_07455 [candidate division WOR-3 bacterium]